MPESEIQQAIGPLVRSVDRVDERLMRIEERINQLPSIYMSRQEYEARHKDLENDVENLIRQLNDSKTAFDKRMDEMKKERISRSERLWARLSPVVAAFAFLLALFEFLTHLRFNP